jgi:nitroimidazol reductase NimA-like FMN-containing flavoprotein (pyridoxamine 5'-phosphate oxidase superfamily)
MPMTSEEIDAFLAEPRLAHFGTVDEEGRPRVRPLWYLWRDGAFWFTTRLEHRHTGRDLENPAGVAISIASEDRPYRAVLAYGRAEVVGKDQELLFAVAARYGEAAAKRWLGPSMKEDDRVAFKVVPETLLAWNYGKGDSTHKQDEGVSMRIASPPG